MGYPHNLINEAIMQSEGEKRAHLDLWKANIL